MNDAPRTTISTSQALFNVTPSAMVSGTYSRALFKVVPSTTTSDSDYAL
jgi:hypothetical protein